MKGRSIKEQTVERLLARSLGPTEKILISAEAEWPPLHLWSILLGWIIALITMRGAKRYAVGVTETRLIVMPVAKFKAKRLGPAKSHPLDEISVVGWKLKPLMGRRVMTFIGTEGITYSLAFGFTWRRQAEAIRKALA